MLHFELTPDKQIYFYLNHPSVINCLWQAFKLFFIVIFIILKLFLNVYDLFNY